MYNTANLLANNPATKQIISGRFVMRPQPGESLGLKRYLALAGITDVTVEEIEKIPLEVSVSEDGTEITFTYGESTTLKFGEPKTEVDSITGKETTSTVRLVSTNSFTLESMTDDGLQELRTFTFGLGGAQVYTVASKPGAYHSLLGNSVVYTSTMERVDGEDKASPLTLLSLNPAARKVMTGRFIMRIGPGDMMALERFLTFTGLDAAMAEEFAKIPLEVSVSDDGTEITLTYGDATTLKFGEPNTQTDPDTGKEATSTARVISSNSFTLESVSKEDGIYELRSFTFGPAGVQATAIASKPGAYNLLIGNSVVFNSFLERVDADDKPMHLMLEYFGV